MVDQTLHPDELAAREWDRIETGSLRSDEPHVYFFDVDDGVDWDRIVTSARYESMPGLFVEHWARKDGRDDYAEWLGVFARHPAPNLEHLAMGGYGDRSRSAHLGAIAPAVRVLPRLRSLTIAGLFDEAEPMESELLAGVSICSDSSAETIARWLGASTLPALSWIQVDASGSPEPLASLLPTVREAVLIGFVLEPAFFAQLASRAPGQLAVLDLTACWWSYDDPDGAAEACAAFEKTASSLELLRPENE